MLLLPTVTITLPNYNDNTLKVTVTTPYKIKTLFITSSDYCLSSIISHIVLSLILSVISLPEVRTEALECPLLRSVIRKQLVKAD
jgi:hypothetical protein